MEDIQREVAHVPENWLRAFIVRHPADIRKFGTSRNSTLLFRTEAILAAVEAGETSGVFSEAPEATGTEA